MMTNIEKRDGNQFLCNIDCGKMKEIYVFGVGKVGETACFYLRDTYKICSVLDILINRERNWMEFQ